LAARLQLLATALQLLATAGAVVVLPMPLLGAGRTANLRVAEGHASTIDSGARIWDAGLALSALLADPSLAGKRILELGSGTGVAGLSAASAGAQVLLSDLPTNVPLLEANIEANRLGHSARAVQLRWGCAADEYQAALAGQFDLICGSDLLYAPNTFDDLLSSLVKLSTPGRTEVLLTYPPRYTEDIFLQEAACFFEECETYEVTGVDVDNIWCTRLLRRDSGP
jgi:predicted nicotinamide N-methyase